MWSIFRGETKPHIYSAFLNFAISVAPLYILFQNGAWYGSVYFWVSSVFWGIIFLLSFKYGFKGITISDKFALIFALITWVIWFITWNIILSVVLIILVDIFGCYPTVRKTYFHPYTESRYAYLFEAIWVFASIFALSTFDFINSAHLIYVLCIDLFMFWIIYFRRRIIIESKN